MNLWLVSIFESTPIDDNLNTRFNALLREAVNRGHTVTFWASTFRHDEKRQRFEKSTVVEGGERVTLRFLRTISYSKNISFQRLYSHRAFGSDLVRAFGDVSEKPDLILFAFPPLSSGSRVVRWARSHQVPCVVDVIDPWPDAFRQHIPFLPKWLIDCLIQPMRGTLRKMLQHVDGVTAISREYIDWARGYCSELEHTRCFYPAVEFDEMQEELSRAAKTIVRNNGRFNVIYAGSFGFSYDIETIIAAAATLEEKYGEAIMFTLAGNGPKREMVEEYCRSHTNMKYIGRVSKKKLMEHYYLADIGMTQHVKGATQSVTYKLFDLLACGLPIMNSLEGEMKKVILDNQVGLHNRPGDSRGLAENIVSCFENRSKLDEMRENGRRLTMAQGDSKRVYSEALNFLESIASR